MNNLYIGLLRLENRAAFFVQAKASQVTPREIAEEQFHTLARGWLAYPVTPAAHATTAEERLQKYHRHVFSEIADAKLLAKIYPVIYTTALRR